MTAISRGRQLPEVDIVVDKRATPHEVTLFETSGIQDGEAWITAESPWIADLEGWR